MINDSLYSENVRKTEQIEGQMSIDDLEDNAMMELTQRDDGMQISNNKQTVILNIPADGSYVEIMGHKIDGDFKNFEGFCNHLIKLERTESNWDSLKKWLKYEINDYENNKWCTHFNIVRGGAMKKLLEKMEELENG